MEKHKRGSLETKNKKPGPLRHGWGGNLKLRDSILKDRTEEVQETIRLSQQVETRGKYQVDEHQMIPFDAALFEGMLVKGGLK